MSKSIIFRVSDDLHRRFRAQCLASDTTMTQWLIEQVEAFIADTPDTDDTGDTEPAPAPVKPATAAPTAQDWEKMRQIIVQRREEAARKYNIPLRLPGESEDEAGDRVRAEVARRSS